MKPIDLLNKHNVKPTNCRKGIVSAVMSAKNALSENEIKAAVSANYDRTTFYRALKILEKNNIIHKIVVDDQAIKYAINKLNDKHQEHIHFYCSQCQSVKCLETMIAKNYKLPKGYVEYQKELIIKGLCKICKKNN